MDGRQVIAALIIVLAFSLVFAPVTMADWAEQASFSTDRVDESELRDDVPVMQFENLSGTARDAVENAISSPEGSHTVYGKADWPDRFVYSDYVAPGRGEYAVVHEGQYYRLTTFAGGGFTFVYWLYEIPIIVYGVVLLWVGFATAEGVRSRRFAVLSAIAGGGFHLLGPALDFPVVSPRTFVQLSVVALLALLAGVVLTRPSGDGAT